MFAVVRFKSGQKERWIVLTSEIKDFCPKTDRDFKEGTFYKVKWQKSDLDLDSDGCYECKIMCLGESWRDLKDNVMKKNMTLPQKKSLLAAAAMNDESSASKGSATSSKLKKNKRLPERMAELQSRKQAALTILKTAKTTSFAVAQDKNEETKQGKNIKQTKEDESDKQQVTDFLMDCKSNSNEESKEETNIKEKKGNACDKKKLSISKEKDCEVRKVPMKRAHSMESPVSTPIKKISRASRRKDVLESDSEEEKVENWSQSTPKKNAEADDTIPVTQSDDDGGNDSETSIPDNGFKPVRSPSFKISPIKIDDFNTDSEFKALSDSSEDSTSAALRELETKYEAKLKRKSEETEELTKKIIGLRAAVKVADDDRRRLRLELDTLRKNSVQNKDIVDLVSSVKNLVKKYDSLSPKSFVSSPSTGLDLEKCSYPSLAFGKTSDYSGEISDVHSSSFYEDADLSVRTPASTSRAQHTKNPSGPSPDMNEAVDEEVSRFIESVSSAVYDDFKGTKPLPQDDAGINVILPGGFKVNATLWKNSVKTSKRESLLIRRLATQMWGYQGLKSRSIKGGTNSKTKEKKKIATPKKVQTIAGCVQGFNAFRKTPLGPIAALTTASLHVGRAMVDEVAKSNKSSNNTEKKNETSSSIHPGKKSKKVLFDIDGEEDEDQ